jgi:hypothetical protein
MTRLAPRTASESTAGFPCFRPCLRRRARECPRRALKPRAARWRESCFRLSGNPLDTSMAEKTSFLDALRNEYETVQHTPTAHTAVEESKVIDARMRKSFRWLEKAITYLNTIKSPIQHRFNLGHGIVFESPRFERGVVGQHTQNMRGFSVIDEINLYYHICASKPITAEMWAIDAELAKKDLERANLKFASRRIQDGDGTVRRCMVTVQSEIPAAIVFRADYKTGTITTTLVNADRFDRVILAFPSNAIKEQMLEDLLKFILGMDRAFLHHSRLAGIQGRPT